MSRCVHGIAAREGCRANGGKMEGTGSDDGRLGGWGRDFPCDICPVDQGALRSACLDLSPRLGGFFDLLQREADALATRQEEGNLLHDETRV